MTSKTIITLTAAVDHRLQNIIGYNSNVPKVAYH